MQTILQILERAGGYRPTLSLKIEKLPCQTILQMPTGYLNHAKTKVDAEDNCLSKVNGGTLPQCVGEMVIYAHEPQHVAQIHRSVTTYSMQNSISDTLTDGATMPVSTRQPK